MTDSVMSNVLTADLTDNILSTIKVQGDSSTGALPPWNPTCFCSTHGEWVSYGALLHIKLSGGGINTHIHKLCWPFTRNKKNTFSSLKRKCKCGLKNKLKKPNFQGVCSSRHRWVLIGWQTQAQLSAMPHFESTSVCHQHGHRLGERSVLWGLCGRFRQRGGEVSYHRSCRVVEAPLRYLRRSGGCDLGIHRCAPTLRWETSADDGEKNKLALATFSLVNCVIACLNSVLVIGIPANFREPVL